MSASDQSNPISYGEFIALFEGVTTPTELQPEDTIQSESEWSAILAERILQSWLPTRTFAPEYILLSAMLMLGIRGVEAEPLANEISSLLGVSQPTAPNVLSLEWPQSLRFELALRILATDWDPSSNFEGSIAEVKMAVWFPLAKLSSRGTYGERRTSRSAFTQWILERRPEGLGALTGIREVVLDNPTDQALILTGKLSKVDHLTISNRAGLSDELLPALPALEMLSLDSCSSDGVLDLSRLPTLNNLSLKSIQNKPLAVSALPNTLRRVFLQNGARLVDPVLPDLQIFHGSREQAPIVDFLAHSTNLRVLDLQYSGVAEIDFCAKMPRLYSLKLKKTGVRDLGPLACTDALEELEIDHTEISDLSPLAQHASLTRLSANFCPITNLSPLSNLQMLGSLDLDHTLVQDLAPLAGLSSLESVQLDQTPITSVSPLSQIPKLRHLNIRGCQVTDLESLESVHSLRGLSVEGLHPIEVTKIARLGSLNHMGIFNCGVQSLRTISGLTELALAGIHQNEEFDLSAEADLPQLKWLSLTRTANIHLKGIDQHPGIHSLSLKWSHVADLRPLQLLPNLLELELVGSTVDDWHQLTTLTWVKMIDLRDTDLSEEDAHSLIAALPECKVVTDWTHAQYGKWDLNAKFSKHGRRLG